jgi:hypothetical protein
LTWSAGRGGWYPTEDVFSSFIESVILIIETCLVVSRGRRPSSRGSHVSVISMDEIDVI